jgi:hypothetical protein
MDLLITILIHPISVDLIAAFSLMKKKKRNIKKKTPLNRLRRNLPLKLHKEQE